MAAAAVTRGTPGGKSQGLSPASPPPRQGAQLPAVRVWSRARGTTVPPPYSPPPCCFRPPSPRQGAPLGAGPHHGPESAETVPPTPHRVPALPLARQVFMNSVQLLLQNIRVCGRDPPTWKSQSPRTPAPFLGGASHPQSQAVIDLNHPRACSLIPLLLCTLASCLAGAAHLHPVVDSFSQPQPHCTPPILNGLPPPLHPRTPGRASSSSHLFPKRAEAQAGARAVVEGMW